MSRKGIGIGLIVVGLAVAAAGGAGWAASRSGTGETPPTTAATAPPTTEAPPTTDAPTTTAAATTSTTATTVAETTSTTGAHGAVEAFVAEMAAAIASGDEEFLYARLHPAVVETYGEEVCRSFIRAEILALVDYRPTGPAGGPRQASIGDVEVEVYDVPVAFTFQGEEFEANASFGLFQGGVVWFGECR